VMPAPAQLVDEARANRAQTASYENVGHDLQDVSGFTCKCWLILKILSKSCRPNQRSRPAPTTSLLI
jgi:hypothetical protein